MSLDLDLVGYIDTTGKGLSPITVFSANITHNLTAMAEAIGLYLLLWHPEVNDITIGRQLIEPLREGIKKLEENESLRSHDDPKGWGTREQFLKFLREVLEGCEEHPLGRIKVSI